MYLEKYGLHIGVYGGMQFKTLFRRILGKSAKSMRGMKCYIDIGFFKWKTLCHYLSMNL
jgi:hypothetical protein